MAVKRTKRQKQQTAQRREEVLSYSMSDVTLSSNNDVKDSEIKLPKQSKKVKKSITFDTSYVKKDLIKTIVVTLLVVGVLIAYTIYVQ
ncbi:MAG: hypothetical protein OEX81_04375 [Candidatus Pacebacteria bacterium]|nr:hypothetical protein [Candidatus Paceibacterota bacterium]